MKKNLKLTELCKKEMNRIIGGTGMHLPCSCACSCACGAGEIYLDIKTDGQISAGEQARDLKPVSR